MDYAVAKFDVGRVLLMHMLALLALILFLTLAMLTASLRSVYGVASSKELSRRAQNGDRVAATLYQVARHGVTADTLLLLLSVGATALTAVIVGDLFPLILATLIISTLMILNFVVLPRRSSKITRKLALKISPYFAKILIKIRPYTNRVAHTVRKYRQPSIAAPKVIYEKEDLLELLERQKTAPHNRIKTPELELAAHALAFGDKKVGDYMIPYSSVHFVSSEEPIGPILMSELYDSDFSRFPVRNHEDAIVGTLFLKDLVDRRTTGIVSNVMSRAISYVDHDASLEDVMDVFVETKHPLLIVRKSAGTELEEITGIITIEDVLEQLMGHKFTA